MHLVPRLSLKWKIFGGCLWISIAILGFNFIYSNRVLHRSARAGLELQGVFRRYQSFQRAMSQGFAAAVDVWATSPRLREALAKGDDEAARPIVSSVASSLDQTVHPDFTLVVDKHGDLSASQGCPVDAADARAMRLFADLRQGMSIHNMILEHKGRAYLVAGAPVSRDSENVGALLIGVRLERLFAEFKAQSDDDPRKQVELALVHNQETSAATAHSDEWDDIARATRAEARELLDEGGERVSVLNLGDGRHDFFSAQVNGYDGASSGSVGNLFVLRNRVEHEARMHSLWIDNLVVLLAALLIVGCASFWLSVVFTRPINDFIAATRDLAHGEGDLTRRIKVRTSALEMAELGDNLNAMFANLQRLASEVQGASFQVGASSAEISAASKQMLSGAKDQATKIESSTAAVTELSSSIQQVADNAMQATKVARDSDDNLKARVEQLLQMRTAVEQTADKIQELGQSGKRIGSIVEVIRQISEQTSLLALNASIEAAHAGEQGRGFAVVADEVSSLARRVGQSAKDIEALIGTITDQTVEAVSSMQNVTRAFGEHVASAGVMQGALKQIVEVVQDTAHSVQEQAVVSDEIARNMDAVQKIAQEVLGASEEAVVQGEQLHTLALRLEELVRGFRIEREERPAEAARALPRAAPALPDHAPDRNHDHNNDRRRLARS
jgi:methyl-accepting chemotaxis protein